MYKNMPPERWFSFSLMEQLANIGMDVERAIRWRNEGNKKASEQAFEASLELFTLTISDPKNKKGRLKELCRARELFIDYFMYENQYNFTDIFWNDYFLYFTYIAAAERVEKRKSLALF